MEVCVDSLESALIAYHGGADRIELCSSLNEGGLTPTLGLFRSIKKYIPCESNFRIFVMIRPRVGDFLYNQNEIETMKEDIKIFVENGVDGLVFGCLNSKGLVDEILNKELVDLIPRQNLIQTTFHRAFDVSSDWKMSLDSIKNLRFDRLLTSGQEKSAYEGKNLIKQIVELNNSENEKPLIIVPGAGINSSNLEEILGVTGCKEFHASCKSNRQSQMEFRNTKILMGSPSIDEYSISTADINKVKNLASIFKKFRMG